MFRDSNNQCICYSGYILKEDGRSCRFNCTSNFIYNPSTNKCELRQITCPTGYVFNGFLGQC
jgi:hypothetical protein